MTGNLKRTHESKAERWRNDRIPAESEAARHAAETPEETAARLKQGKGAPTPTRREQEAARKRPLVPTDRKEAARAARAHSRPRRARRRASAWPPATTAT